MKRLIAVLLVCMLLVPLVWAASPEISAEPAQERVQNQTQNETQVMNQTQVMIQAQITSGPGQPSEVADRQQDRAQIREELNLRIRERKQELDQELEGMGTRERAVYENQNRVRLAVHAMLALEELDGGIGSEIAPIAREFNNSLQVTVRAEEQIQSRSGIARFLAGGDADAAREIQQQVIENRNRIREMNRIIEGCDCDEETKLMLQEQLQNMEQEQNRLENLAGSELKDRGLLGWLWK
jgi:hypothetical protein